MNEPSTIIITTRFVDELAELIGPLIHDGTILSAQIVPANELKTLRPDLAPHQLRTVE